MLNVGIIGIGNCGNQIALLAAKEADCDVFAINTSENDLSTLPDTIKKKVVGDSNGSGKDRKSALAMLEKSVMGLIKDEDFVAFCQNKDVIIIASSMGGGTGSGMAPIMSKIIGDSVRNPDGSAKIVIIAGVLPRINEGEGTQVNAIDYLHELYDVLDKPTYMIYDNNAYKNASASVVLDMVNAAIVDDIKVIQCRYCVATRYDSIDEKDMRILLRTPGRIFISSLRGIKEKDLDETTMEDLLIENIKTNAHAEIQRDGIVSRTGIITNLSPKLNGIFDTHISKIREFVGEPTDEFLHIAVNEEKTIDNNVFLILTGLSKINDRIDKITDRIEEIEKKKAEMEAEKDADVTFTTEDIAAMNARRNDREEDTNTGDVNLGSIFGMFKS